MVEARKAYRLPCDDAARPWEENLFPERGSAEATGCPDVVMGLVDALSFTFFCINEEERKKDGQLEIIKTEGELDREGGKKKRCCKLRVLGEVLAGETKRGRT
jgi:hypothetical protein